MQTLTILAEDLIQKRVGRAGEDGAGQVYTPENWLHDLCIVLWDPRKVEYKPYTKDDGRVHVEAQLGTHEDFTILTPYKRGNVSGFYAPKEYIDEMCYVARLPSELHWSNRQTPYIRQFDGPTL
jgi:hypothetical protein